MPVDDDDDLAGIWDELEPVGVRENLPPEFNAEPGDLVLGTSSNNVLAIIKRDGRVQLPENNPEQAADQAAMLFWESMGRRRLDMEDRLLLIDHMEGALTRLGAADLHNEACRRNLMGRQSTENLLAAQRAQTALERAMTQCIELGRGLTRRPEVTPVEVPRAIPRRVADNPESAYEGREGFGEVLGDLREGFVTERDITDRDSD